MVWGHSPPLWCLTFIHNGKAIKLDIYWPMMDLLTASTWFQKGSWLRDGGLSFGLLSLYSNNNYVHTKQLKEFCTETRIKQTWNNATHYFYSHLLDYFTSCSFLDCYRLFQHPWPCLICFYIQLFLDRTHDAEVGDAKHNNLRRMNEHMALVSKFGDESRLCNNILWQQSSKIIQS